MTLIEALEIRIPQVEDKEKAYKKLQEHFANGDLSEYQAQRFTDMLFPVKYDEEGNQLNEQTIFNSNETLKKAIKQYRWEQQLYYTYYGHRQRFKPYDVQRMNDVAEALQNGDITEVEWNFADDSTKTITDFNYLINLKSAGYQNEQKMRDIEKQLLADETVTIDNYKDKFDALVEA